ncbi:UNVERIFIED_CONTAM: hypothetical protein FKN15_006762 [Acipenser sinensis]
MSAGSTYNDEKGGSSNTGEPEYGHDPASGGIFSSDYKREWGFPSVFLSTLGVLDIEGMLTKVFKSIFLL